jgi:hypothetical protein
MRRLGVIRRIIWGHIQRRGRARREAALLAFVDRVDLLVTFVECMEAKLIA